MQLRFVAPIIILLSSSAITPALAQGALKSSAGASARSARPAAQAPLPIVELKYEKVVMPNGLTLIVHEDHRVPVVTVATYYHVGSSNETPGRTGFAHLFEHLMFNGSQNADDDWFKFMNEIGATGMNGTTNQDRTNYYQTVPTSGLDRVLWYESDRMRNLLPAIDQAKLDEQRKVVQNEKRQRANTPLGALPEMMYANIYPKGHPYSWPVIGSMEDLNAATLDDVKTFFNTWYGASNAILVLSGDITLAEAREKVQKYYGSIPSGPPIQRAVEQIAPMAGPSRGKFEAAVANPQIIRVWNAPGLASRDTQLLRLAATAMTSGENSFLQRRLVREQQLASQIEVEVNALELGSQVIISATPRAGVTLARLEAAVDVELANFLRDGLSPAALDRIKFRGYADAVSSQTSTLVAASRLADGELYAGNPGQYEVEQRIINAASADDVLAVARRWLGPNSYTIEVEPVPSYSVASADVDRSTKPAMGKMAPFALPPLQRATLSNGVKVMLAERHDVPVVTMSMSFDVGSLPDRNLESTGLSLAVGLGTLGTKRYSALQIADRLQELGAQISWNSDNETTRLVMRALNIRFDETLDLYSEILFNPTFPKDEWDRKRVLFRTAFEENKKLPRGKIALISSRLLYGDKHPYAAVLTPDIADKLTVDDFRTFYSKWIRPDLATILIVGDTTLAEIVPKLESRFSAWKPVGPKPVKAELPPAVRPTKPRVILVDQPGAATSLISVAETGPARNTPDFDVLDVANTVLGGGFLSRLNMNLREAKGWSYGARSVLGSAPFIGELGVGTSVQTDRTADAMSEISREIRELATTRPPSVAEIQTAKNTMLLGMIAELQSPQGTASLYRDIERFGLPEDYWNTYVPRIEALTDAQIDAAAKKLYRPAELTWFVVGDLSKIESDIRKLRIGEVMVYDADGRRVR